MTKHEQITDEKQLSMCEGKARMPRQVAKVAARRQRKKGQTVEAYKCQYCRAWHVGSQEWAKPPEYDGSSKIRPTPERAARGEWVAVGGKAAVERYVRDMAAHPIDALEHAGKISPEQAHAGRQFEHLYRKATQTPGIRDSCTIWEPVGYESDDGNVEAVRDRHELYLFLGYARDLQLRSVCVDQVRPKNDNEVGMLREALNDAERFFSHGKKKR